MSMINPADPPEVQVQKQARIIEALLRRAGRQKDVGPSAYRAFQSAIDLQQQVAAQTVELESVRSDRERNRRALVDALASMEEGFALFCDGKLEVCNDLFRGLLPDISAQVTLGLPLARYLKLMEASEHLVSSDRKISSLAVDLHHFGSGSAGVTVLAELSEDRWYQMSVQRTSSENTALLLTEITALVRRNRIERENLIDRQADYLAAAFQNMSSGVCTFNSRGEVMMQNGRFREILGVPLTLLQPGTPLLTLLQFMRARGIIADDNLFSVDDWRDRLTRKGSLQRRMNHGRNRVLEVHANVLPDGGFLVELKDVTLEVRSTVLLENRVMERTAELTRANARLTEQYEEKARVEEELRLAKERAEAAVATKTLFLAAVSHDLLQPINAAKLLISTLQQTTQGTKFDPMVERLQGAFDSVEYLLHSLLDISRLESAEPDAVCPVEVDLGALMHGIRADQMPVAAKNGVQLDVVLPSVFVRSDPVYLLRSVQNLVVNALQYTPPGGRVLLGCRRRGGKIRLEVWDTGIGIAAADQLRIFDTFTRAGDVPLGSGVGLGLSVVDRACRLLGHTLEVRSAPGRGSVFSIEMDVISAPAALRLTDDALVDYPAQPLDYIVMVVENDADVLFGTTKWLEQCGASVLAARSTQEALDHVADMGIPPDVVLADYQLDGTDTGVTAIMSIREAARAHVPAILITADHSEMVRCLGQEHDLSVMTKPAELTRLRPLIDWKVRHHAAMLARQNESPTVVVTDEGPR